MGSFTLTFKKGSGLPVMSAYTPSLAKSAGDVVVINGRPSVIHQDIAASALGARAIFGGIYTGPAAGAMNAGDGVFWDAGALNFTKVANGNSFFGYLTEDSSATTLGDIISVFHNPTGAGTSGKLYSAIAASTAIANTTTETLCDKNFQIPANTLRAGDVLRVRAQGIATLTNSTDTLAAKLYLGGLLGTLICTCPALDVANNDIFYIDAEIVIRTDGATGTLVATGTVQIGPQASATVKAFSLPSTVIDTTAAQTVGVSLTWSVANAGDSARLDVLDVNLSRA